LTSFEASRICTLRFRRSRLLPERGSLSDPHPAKCKEADQRSVPRRDHLRERPDLLGREQPTDVVMLL